MEKKILFLTLLVFSLFNSAWAADIFVKDANTVWSDTLKASAEMENLGASFAPRIMLVYSKSVFHAGLNSIPSSLADLVNQLPATQRLIINGAMSAFQRALIFSNLPLKVKNKKEEKKIPGRFALYQNYPNPFNSSTVIRFDLPMRSFVRLTVFDIEGRKIRVLANRNFEQGHHAVHFRAHSLPSGLYVYKIKAGNYVCEKKLLLIK